MSPARLSRKLLAGLAAGLGLASAVFLVFIVQTYHSRLGEERAHASAQVTRLLQVSLENAMLKRDLPGLQEIVTRLGQQPGIASVMIVNPGREVRFANDPALVHKHLSPVELGCSDCGDTLKPFSATTQLMQDLQGNEVLRSVNPINNKPECKECHGLASTHPVNGILVVDHEARSLRLEALKAAGAMSGAGLLVTLLGLGSVWWVLKRQVLSPIYGLENASKSLAAGDLDARVAVDKSGSLEFIQLFDSFNTMAEKIESGVHEVREKEAFLKALIDTVPDGVRVIDQNYTVVMANSSYARQAMVGAHQLTGVPCYAIHGRSERCPPTLTTCPFHAIQEDNAPIKYVHRHVRGDGSELYVETTAARLTIDRAGKREVLIIEAMRDLEQQLKYSQEQRMSEIGQLAAGVAHEIYNPLASIRLGLQAVLRKTKSSSALDAEANDYLSMVDGEVDKCISVTKRLLDLSQSPSQSLQLVSFSTVVPDVVSLLRYEAEQADVTLDLDLAPDLRVLATDAELRMLVLNLAQNAFHAMPKGGALTVRGRREENDVVITFKDTGVGIAPDAMPHIFDPFYSKRADGVQGTGLGLTICKAIATRYHGTISCRSTPEAGTTFTLTFPHADVAEAHG